MQYCVRLMRPETHYTMKAFFVSLYYDTKTFGSPPSKPQCRRRKICLCHLWTSHSSGIAMFSVQPGTHLRLDSYDADIPPLTLPMFLLYDHIRTPVFHFRTRTVRL
eukprot:jgi/Ulvmu1/5468/UM023_0004.1